MTLSSVYHGESSALEMQHRTRSYTTLTEDTTRVMSRLKALFRSQAITARGKQLFRPQYRESYLAQLSSDGLRHRAQCLYQELDALQPLRRQAKRAMVAEGRKNPATKWLQSVPFLGKVRSAVLIGRVQTPHRFRTKRQFWAYCGLALETRDSAEYCLVNGQVTAQVQATDDSGPELEPQPRPEEPVQEHGHHGQRSQGYAAGDGTAHTGT